MPRLALSFPPAPNPLSLSFSISRCSTLKTFIFWPRHNFHLCGGPSSHIMRCMRCYSVPSPLSLSPLLPFFRILPLLSCSACMCIKFMRHWRLQNFSTMATKVSLPADVPASASASALASVPAATLLPVPSLGMKPSAFS